MRCDSIRCKSCGHEIEFTGDEIAAIFKAEDILELKGLGRTNILVHADSTAGCCGRQDYTWLHNGR